ncbi:hypothetical protein TWF730_009362 [Orbilia blumenaviensis]|uniref:Peptidase metallopeptidase domain-containing protein n=1 Tax=Orbilia blumenaviensis TaxID=1796055 RepID=A0AAV9UZM6_9PEZI
MSTLPVDVDTSGPHNVDDAVPYLPAYDCQTETNSNVGAEDLRFGRHDSISILAAGVTVTYFVDLDTFKSDIDSEFVAASFQEAVRQWGPIPLTFKRVWSSKAAFFRVIASDVDFRRSYARAFFPDYPQHSRLLVIYPLALKHKYAMVNILSHELGHIMGIRHSFAGERERDPSVLFGFHNPYSVMRYTDPLNLQVHWLDIDLLIAFYRYAYDHPEGYGGFPIQFIVPPGNS